MRQESSKRHKPTEYKVGTQEWRHYLDECWQEGPHGSKKPLSHLFSFEQFKGNRCFIVAGGPSLRRVDLSKLEGQYTIGLNKACSIPGFNSWLLFTWDKVIYNWYQTQLIKCPVVVVDLDNQTRDRVFYVRSAGDYGMPTQIDRLYIGTHMGYVGINLAIALGFSPIYLLGYDFKQMDGKYHATDDWGCKPDYDQNLKSFKEELSGIPEYLPESIEIINLNPESALDSFPFADLEEVI
jgi:hypothetical protein